MYVVDGDTEPVSSVILFNKSDLSCINDELENTDWCEAINSEGASEKYELASKQVWKYIDGQKQRPVDK